jgi:hypothetical protein
VTERKQVDEAIRAEIARAISRLLDERTADGKKVWTQERLGLKLGVSQEAARRAQKPDGVTPKIVEGMRAAFQYAAFPVVHVGHADATEEAREEQATEILVRRGVGLREAERAIKGARAFKSEQALEPEEWANLGHALVMADHNTKKPKK